MRLRVAVLADYCNIAEGGKLNVLGIFGTIFGLQEPIVHLDMQLVLQFEFEADEAGQKNLQVMLLDEDGRQILGLDGAIEVPLREDREPVSVNSIVRFANVKFPRFGCYEFRVLLDGEQQTIIPVAVRKVKNRPPASPA